MSNIVTNWFGESFYKLDPLLQDLHINGGVLSGEVNLEYGSGISGLLGKKLGIKLGLPSKTDKYEFEVSILQKEEKLIWSRKFGEKYIMTSVFEPCGRYPNGIWKETTGFVTLELGVDVLQGGWYWTQKNIKLTGFNVPMFLFPRSIAFKRINNGKYEFSVTLTLPFFGKLFGYYGILSKL